MVKKIQELDSKNPNVALLFMQLMGKHSGLSAAAGLTGIGLGYRQPLSGGSALNNKPGIGRIASLNDNQAKIFRRTTDMVLRIFRPPGPAFTRRAGDFDPDR